MDLFTRKYYFYNKDKKAYYIFDSYIDTNLRDSIYEFIKFLYNEKNRGEDDSFLKFLSEILLFNCKDEKDRKQIYEYYVEDDILPKEKEYYCINDEKDSPQFKEAKEIVRMYKFPYGEDENYWYLFCSGPRTNSSHKRAVEKLNFDRRNLFG